LATALALAAVGAAGAWWSRHRGIGREAEAAALPAAPAASAAPAVRVEVVRPGRKGIRRVTTQPGSVHAFESVDLYAKVSGYLKDQAVDIGDNVQRGQVLAGIDAPELVRDVEDAAAVVEQSRAHAAQAEAQVATAQAEVRTAAAALAQARADIARLVAQRRLANKQLERVRGLYAHNAVDRKLVDEQEEACEAAVAGERTAEAAVATAEARQVTAQARLHSARADVDEARAAIHVAEARLARARVVVSYLRIVAPFDGVVTTRNFHPGAFIRSAAEGASLPLLTVRRTDVMRVVVQVSDSDVDLLDVGDPATIAIDALRGAAFRGSVSRMADSQDSTSRTMRVEIDLKNPSGRLHAGMFGRVTIELQPTTTGLTIPAACLAQRHGDARGTVYVVRDGRARSASITLGGDDGAVTEVVSGLGPADLVVLHPQGSLEDGVAVVTDPDPTRPDRERSQPGDIDEPDVRIQEKRLIRR
jgi:RND family efflux transporter MFP subunit